MIVVFFRCLALRSPLKDCLIHWHRIFRWGRWWHRFRTWLTSEGFRVEYDRFARTFGARGTGGSWKRDAPAGLGRLGGWFLFRDGRCVGGGRVIDYVPSRSDMRNRAPDEIRNSL